MSLTADNKYTSREICILLLILALGLMLRLTFLHEPFERDEGVYAYLGQVILEGGIPYRDLLEIKPLGIYYIYAIGIALFGATTEAIRLFTACYSLVTGICIFVLARKLAGPRAGLCAALLFSIYSSAPNMQGSSSNTEVFMLLPLVLGTYFLLSSYGSRKRLYLSLCGLSAACALLIKTVALPQVAVLLGMALLNKTGSRKPKEIVGDAISLMLPMVLLAGGVMLYFDSNGVLNEFLYWNVVFPAKYIKADLTGNPASEAMHLLFPEFHLLLFLALPTAAWQLFRKRDREHLLLLLWILAAGLGVLMPGKFFPHYFIQLLPPLAIAAGIGLGELTRLRGKCSIASMVLVALLFFHSVYYDYKFYLVYTPEDVSIAKYSPIFVNSARLAEYIKERTLPSDYIFQWGMAMELYFLSNRRAPNKYVNNMLITWSREPQSAVLEMAQSIDEKKPVYIYVDLEWTDYTGWPELQNILMKSYFLEHEDYYGQLYRRNLGGTERT